MSASKSGRCSANAKCCCACWPTTTGRCGARGSTAPPLNKGSTAAGRPFNGESIVVDAELVNGLHCLFARNRASIDSLSPREREVAGCYARGENHLHIAGSLGVSPVTVRNQIQSVYRKPGINNKAELVTRMKP